MQPLKFGDAGPEVGKLQQALLEAGESIDAPDLAAMQIGTSTDAAIKEFQSRHPGPDGHPLTVDGVVGPATEWALSNPGASLAPYKSPGWEYEPAKVGSPVAAVVAAAVADIGLHETPDGSNDGPMLRKFKTYGRPWCALAVSEWFMQAPSGSPMGCVAAAQGILNWGKAHGKQVTTPEPGDVFVIVRASGHGHTGLIVSVSEDGSQFCTVEGNCGNAVRGMIRTKTAVSGFVRILP